MLLRSGNRERWACDFVCIGFWSLPQGWAPNLGPHPILSCLCGLKRVGLISIWVYRDSRLGAHTKGPGF